MAYWRDNLRPASFRGVAFEVEGSSGEFGRKVAVHDFPLRDSASTEDMGQAARTFSIDGFIIGPDYMTGRDAMVAALETPGPGILIHPWYGQRRVTLTAPAQLSESTREGGICRFTLDFVEEPETAKPVQFTDTTAAVSETAADLHAQATTSLTETFSVLDQLDIVLDDAKALVSDLSEQFDDLTAPLKAQGAALDSFIAKGLALRSDIVGLVTKPVLLAAQLSGMIRGIRTIAATPADALTALKGLLRFGETYRQVSVTTPTRQVQADNRQALFDFVRQSAAAESVLAIADMDFAAYDDAVAVRDDMADRLDNLALAAADGGNDVAYRAIADARLSMIQDVTARGGDLARLRSFVPLVTVPALVLAYRLYDDVSRIEEHAEDIIARNRITHPGFVPAGVTLEVVNDV
ncbi:hypothetical protein MMA231_00980 [Asticcacaulis sp. MM231]|uniref:DNA circularization protein n=1 Tax=Asticcacaulis sp. MM231 TaxID=3157666 RepID=UPI0032D5AB17